MNAFMAPAAIKKTFVFAASLIHLISSRYHITWKIATITVVVLGFFVVETYNAELTSYLTRYWYSSLSTPHLCWKSLSSLFGEEYQLIKLGKGNTLAVGKNKMLKRGKGKHIIFAIILRLLERIKGEKKRTDISGKKIKIKMEVGKIIKL